MLDCCLCETVVASCWGTPRNQCVAGHRMHAEAMAPLAVQGGQCILRRLLLLLGVLAHVWVSGCLASFGRLDRCSIHFCDQPSHCLAWALCLQSV
jgi:hypothetical protein